MTVYDFDGVQERLESGELMHLTNYSTSPLPVVERFAGHDRLVVTQSPEDIIGNLSKKYGDDKVVVGQALNPATQEATGIPNCPNMLGVYVTAEAQKDNSIS